MNYDYFNRILSQLNGNISFNMMRLRNKQGRFIKFQDNDQHNQVQNQFTIFLPKLKTIFSIIIIIMIIIPWLVIISNSGILTKAYEYFERLLLIVPNGKLCDETSKESKYWN